MDKIFKFRRELLENLSNIISTSGDVSPQELYKMELDYLKKILFESKELERLLGDKE